jgi:LPS-assembly lipoprotein
MIARSAVMFGVVLMLAACGFQLRGSIQPIDGALNPMVIESVNPGSALLPPLRRALVDSGAELAARRSPAGSLLRITADGMDQRVTAVSAQGRPREMELIYRVEFELHGPDGFLVENRAVTLSREFAVDERDVLGKAQEAEVLRAGLVRDMVAALTRQLAAVRTQ